jgi:hypothetical protein
MEISAARALMAAARRDRDAGAVIADHEARLTMENHRLIGMFHESPAGSAT